MRGSRWVAAVTAMLALGTFGLFAVLCVRHAGDSYFLGDQIDQLQNFERLLHLEPYGLWGGWMSGTNPPARALGPLTAIVFGLPLKLGLGPDGAHWLTSGLLVLGAVAAFVALARLDVVLAWVWFAFFTASGVVWWSAGILWANAVLLPLGCLFLAVLVEGLRRPSIARFGVLILVLLFALQAHLVVLAAVPAVVVAIACAWRPARNRPLSRPAAAGIAAGVIFAIGPYVLAEAQTSFANTHRIAGHISDVSAQDSAPGRAAFAQVLQMASDPTGVLQSLGLAERQRIAVAGGVALVALIACLLVRAPRGGYERDDEPDRNAMWWLTLTAIVGILGQAAFFILANRPILDFHYIEFLVPLYGIPFAALVAAAVRALPDAAGRGLSVAFGVACAALLAARGPAAADKAWERTEWTFARISTAVATLCAPVGAARTVEGQEFSSPTPGYDPVLKYLMTRGLVACRYDRSSQALLAAQMHAPYPPSRTEADGEYRLISVTSPGLALYRRIGVGGSQASGASQE